MKFTRRKHVGSEAMSFVEAIEKRLYLAVDPLVSVSEVSSSRVALEWGAVSGASQVRVYLGAEPPTVPNADLPGQVLLATLPGSATSFQADRLAAAVDAFFRVEIDQPSGEGAANVHARTIGGPDPTDTVLDTPLREVHAYGPNILQIVMTDVQTTAAGAGNDGAMWESGSWTVKRGDGTPIEVVQVHRHSVPIGAYDMQIGYATPYSDTIINIDHRLFLVLDEEIGSREILSISGPFDTQFLLPFSDDFLETPVLQVNQVGYNPRATERWAYLSGWMGSGGTLPLAGFSNTANVLVESDDPLVPRSAALAGLPIGLRSANDAMAGGEVRQIDLSLVPAAEGTRYRVQIPGVGVSWVTAVSEEAVFKAYYTVFRGLTYQRWGVDLDEDFSEWVRPADHPTVYVGNKAYNANAPSQTFNDQNASTSVEIPMVGGWHDAGDFDQSTHHTVVTQMLLRAFETDTARFTDGQLNLPMQENGNGIPDALDEALWGVRGWASLQAESGGIHAGVESWRHPWGYYFADDDPLPYWTFAVDTPHTARVAGLFAQAAFNVAPYDSELSEDLKQRAISAYAYAKNNGAPNYLLLYGASELYRLTGSSAYKSDFEAYWDAGAFSNVGAALARTGASYDFVHAYLAMPAARSDIKTAFDTKVAGIAKDSTFIQQETWAHRNLRTPNVNQDWGNDTVQTKYLEGILAAFRSGEVSAENEQSYINTLSLAADYILGGNANGMVWFTGLGSRHIENVLQLDSLVFDKLGNDQMPGIGVYGITQWIASNTSSQSSKSAFYPAVDANYPQGLRHGDSRVLVVNNEYTVHEVQAPHIALFSALLGQDLSVPASWLPGGEHHRSDLPEGMAAENRAPTVSAGPSQGITAPSNSVELKGQAYDDGFAASTLTTTWTKVSGPGTVTFSAPNALSPTATFSTPGTYVLQLHASDGALHATDTVTVSIAGAEEFEADERTVALYRFNDGLNDAGFNGAHLTAYGNATVTNSDLGWMSTPSGNALRVQNAGDYVTASIPDELFMRPRGSLTIEARLKINAYKVNGVTAGPVLGLVQEWDSNFTFNDPKYGDPLLQAGGSTVVDATTWANAFSTGQWHRLKITYDVSTHTTSVYVDGALIGSNVKAQAERTLPWLLTIGNFDGFVDEVRISQGIRETNFAPVVHAGIDQQTVRDGFVYIAARVNDDDLPSGTLSTAWSKVSGPGAVTFGNANALQTTASFSAAGTYVLRLTASDGSLVGTDDITIDVVNRRPWLSAGEGAESIGLTTTLAGAAHDDGLPTSPGALSYTWSQVSGPGSITFADANALTTAATFSLPGLYRLRLSATDGALATWDEVEVVLRPANQYPLSSDVDTIALWNFNGNAEDASGNGFDLTLFGNAELTDENLLWMTQPVGSALRVRGLGDYAGISIPDSVLQPSTKPISLEARFYVNAYKAYGVNDTHLMTLFQHADARIQIQQGKWTTPQVPRVFLNGVEAMTAAQWSSAIQAGAWHSIKLNLEGNGQASIYLNGQLWGTASTTTNASRTNAWVLTLGNFDGYIDDVRISDVVRVPTSNLAPEVSAGTDAQITWPNDLVQLDGTVADDGEPVNQLTSSWSLVSGPGTVSFADASSADTSATFSNPGNYRLRLTASDTQVEAFDEVEIVVLPASDEYTPGADTIALYHFNGNYNDASGNGYTLTAQGNATRTNANLGWMNSPGGQVLRTTSLGDYVTVSIPDSALMPTGGQSFTMEARVYARDYLAYGVDNVDLLGIWQNADTAFQINDRKWNSPAGPSVIMNGTTLVGSSAWQAAFSLNTWHVVTLTYDHTTGAITCYVDGDLVASATDYANVSRTGNWVLTIGNFDGDIDEVILNKGVATPLSLLGAEQSDTSAPLVQAMSINGGAAQRSTVDDISITFDEPVILAPGSVVLQTYTGAPVPNATLRMENPSGDRRTYRAAVDIEGGPGKALGDGVYQLRVLAGGVTDLAGNAIAADWAQAFHRLFGDGNGDKIVDTLDLVDFRSRLNRPASEYVTWWDSNADSKIDNLDLLALRTRFGTRLIY